MISYSVIGAGNLGASLIHALSEKGYKLKYIYRRSRYSQFDQKVENDLQKIVSASDVIFISVQESGIRDVVSEIVPLENISEKIFFHTSNALTSEEMAVLKEKGGLVASFSPLQTFPDFEKDIDMFKGVYFLSEGDPAALETADRIAEDLNAFNLKVNRNTKAFFHIGAVISSNFLNSLIRFSDIQIKKGGDFNYEILLPLVKQTLKNIECKGIDKALTGPVSRGESEIVTKHLNMLEGKEKELYKLLSGLISG
ncbi:MAG: DUF2520 domain-containing protein [Acidobacteriota bacterium]